MPFKIIIEYIFILGAGQAIFLSIFLFKKKENKLANKILAVTMILFTIDLITAAFALDDYLKQFPAIIGLTQALPLVYGPAVFLFVYLVSRQNERFKWKYLLHFLPFGLSQIYGLFFFYFQEPAYQLNIFYADNPLPWHIKAWGIFTAIQSGIYLLFVLRETKIYNKKLKLSFSYIDKINFNWIRNLVIYAIALWILAVVVDLLSVFQNTAIRADIINYIAISIFLFVLAYKSLQRHDIRLILDEPLETNTKTDENAGRLTYKKSGLSEDAADEYQQKLLKLMDDEKPYLNNKINLSDLSVMLGVSAHNLSEIINTKLNQNFYDFINKYRVEEVQRLIREDTEMKFSILALGYEAGFSSKSAFYSAFKKFSGQTPAQYREEIS